jgi:hypothetical protein
VVVAVSVGLTHKMLVVEMVQKTLAVAAVVVEIVLVALVVMVEAEL